MDIVFSTKEETGNYYMNNKHMRPFYLGDNRSDWELNTKLRYLIFMLKN